MPDYDDRPTERSTDAETTGPLPHFGDRPSPFAARADEGHYGAQPAYATAPEPLRAEPEHGATPASADGASFRKDKRRGLLVPLVAGALVAGLLGGAAAGAGTALALRPATTTTAAGTATDPGNQNVVINNEDTATVVSAVAAKASPSVVTLSVTSSSGSGSGSGVVLSADGYVLTNTHVVTLGGGAANAEVSVTTADGRIYQAEIVGTDPLYDLAVIKLTGATGLQPMEFADSSDLNVGDTTIAIGAPLGLANTVTNGIVSALNRSIQVASAAAPEGGDGNSGGGDSNGNDSPFDFWNFDDSQGGTQATSSISLAVIQTDAAINPGNSGGALLDAQGRLIGINVAIASAGSATGGQSGSIGVGFAIPSNVAQRIAGELRENGEATHGLLGANVGDAAADGEFAGASIQSVVADGAAAAAGLQEGDVVTDFNGVPVTSATDLTAQVRALAGGASAEVTYLRDGEEATATVELGTYTP